MDPQEITRACDHLYVAMLLTLPSDHPLLVAHVREALGILAPERLERADRLLAEVAAKRAVTR